jgi:hypothetical protein
MTWVLELFMRFHYLAADARTNESAGPTFEPDKPWIMDVTRPLYVSPSTLSWGVDKLSLLLPFALPS